ncbi:MAG: hypothetical protein E6G66_03090 [Actinobacteria bacterium]|nr:MAG: hypothetical protein E6G66_03090 [Actinomycetota bacterium]
MGVPQTWELALMAGCLTADALASHDAAAALWLIVPITEMQVRDPVRLVSQMARIIAAREARMGPRC